ncbi:hypothetical protein [Duganella sp. P38]
MEASTNVNSPKYVERGIAFADALHRACYQSCERMVSFDNRKFARRVVLR